jgi:predicted nucleic acid-binding protein
VNGRRRYVIDANTVVKWFVEENLSGDARRVAAAGAQLLAPELILAEIGNAFLKKIRQGELSQEGALVALESARRSLILHSSEPLSSSALEIAMNYQRSFYEALYVALAQQEDCRLITADERLVNALRSRLGETVVWLGDMPGGVV